MRRSLCGELRRPWLTSRSLVLRSPTTRCPRRRHLKTPMDMDWPAAPSRRSRRWSDPSRLAARRTRCPPGRARRSTTHRPDRRRRGSRRGREDERQRRRDRPAGSRGADGSSRTSTRGHVRTRARAIARPSAGSRTLLGHRSPRPSARRVPTIVPGLQDHVNRRRPAPIRAASVKRTDARVSRIGWERGFGYTAACPPRSFGQLGLPIRDQDETGDETASTTNVTMTPLTRPPRTSTPWWLQNPDGSYASDGYGRALHRALSLRGSLRAGRRVMRVDADLVPPAGLPVERCCDHLIDRCALDEVIQRPTCRCVTDDQHALAVPAA